MKHTWKALKIQPVHVDDNNSWEVINDDNDIIATNLTEANARLIASAPDMLELLDLMSDELQYAINDQMGDESCTSIVIHKALLTKIEGKQ